MDSLPNFLTHGAPLARFARESSAIINTFFSKLFYCFTVWSNSSRTVTGSPKFRLSYCKRKRRFDHITPALKELRWLPVNELLYYRGAIMAFKCMTGRAPGYLSAQFRRCNVTVRKSRNSSFKNHLAVYYRRVTL